MVMVMGMMMVIVLIIVVLMLVIMVMAVAMFMVMMPVMMMVMVRGVHFAPGAKKHPDRQRKDHDRGDELQIGLHGFRIPLVAKLERDRCQQPDQQRMGDGRGQPQQHGLRDGPADRDDERRHHRFRMSRLQAVQGAEKNGGGNVKPGDVFRIHGMVLAKVFPQHLDQLLRGIFMSMIFALPMLGMRRHHMVPDMALDDLQHQAIGRAAKGRQGVQNLITLAVFLDGAAQSFQLSLQPPDAGQELGFVLLGVCHATHTIL
jgi:hypothetical protein